MSSEIQCGTAEDALSIFRQAIAESDGSPYVDCENNSESLLSLLKQMLYVDGEGNVYINLV